MENKIKFEKRGFYFIDETGTKKFILNNRNEPTKSLRDALHSGYLTTVPVSILNRGFVYDKNNGKYGKFVQGVKTSKNELKPKYKKRRDCTFIWYSSKGKIECKGKIKIKQRFFRTNYRALFNKTRA